MTFTIRVVIVIVSFTAWLASSVATAGDREWSPVQPPGGIAQKFIDAGDRLYMAARNRVYRSDDDGDSWSATASLPSAIRLLAASPADPDLLFAGTQQSGLLRSVDAGQSWVTVGLAPGDAVQNRPVTGLVIRHDDLSVMFASVSGTGSESGIHFSVDGGGTWTRNADAAQPSSVHIQSLAMHPADSLMLFAGTFEDGIFRTTDGGDNWDAVNTGLDIDDMPITTIEIAADGTIFTGSNSTPRVYHSTDNGDSWAQVMNGLPADGSGLGFSVLAFNRVDPDRIYAGFDGPTQFNGDTLYRSVDGGTNWSPMARPDAVLRGPGVHGFHSSSADADRLLVGTSRGNFLSDLGGDAWTASNDGFANPVISNFSLGGDSPGRLYATSRTGGIFTTGDWGETWVPRNDGLVDSDVSAAVSAPDDDNFVITSVNFEAMYRSMDGGTSWVEAASGQARLDSVIVFDPSNSNIVYMLDESGNRRVRKSVDGGQNWILRTTGLPDIDVTPALAISVSAPDTLVVGTPEGAFRTTDGAESWHSIQGDLGLMLVTALAIHPEHEDTIFAGFFREGLHRTFDAGESWSVVWEADSLDDSVRAVAIHPDIPSRMLIATDRNGVLGTIDGGTNWIAMNDGLVPASPAPFNNRTVEGIAFDPHVEARYFVSAQGVLQQFDGGIATDLMVAATRTPASVEVGGEIDVEFALATLDGYPATGIEFSLTYPSFLTLEHFTFDGADCVVDGDVLECTVASIPAGEDRPGAAKLTGESAGDGQIEIQATPVEHDVDTSHNTVSMSVTVTEPPPPPPPPPPSSPPPSGGGGGGGCTLGGTDRPFDPSLPLLWLLALAYLVRNRSRTRRLLVTAAARPRWSRSGRRVARSG